MTLVSLRYQLVLLLLPAIVLLTNQTAVAVELRKETIHVGYIRSQIYGVNRQDAEAAFKTLSRTIGVQHGYEVDAYVHSFADARELAVYLEHAPLNIIILDTWNYLDVCDIEELEPIFAYFGNGRVLQRYVLLTGSKDVHSIADLRNKKINVLSGNTSLISQHWLESLLESVGTDSPEQFFGQFQYQNEPMATVLPVFFGKIDAAVIEEAKFELMQEMNPQLRKLRPIAVSEPLLLSMVCFGRSSWSSPEIRDIMIRALKTLPNTPAGQQILTLFKTEKVVPFEPGFLDSIWKLKNKTGSFTVSCLAGKKR